MGSYEPRFADSVGIPVTSLTRLAYHLFFLSSGGFRLAVGLHICFHLLLGEASSTTIEVGTKNKFLSVFCLIAFVMSKAVLTLENIFS